MSHSAGSLWMYYVCIITAPPTSFPFPPLSHYTTITCRRFQTQLIFLHKTVVLLGMTEKTTSGSSGEKHQEPQADEVHQQYGAQCGGDSQNGDKNGRSQN